MNRFSLAFTAWAAFGSVAVPALRAETKIFLLAGQSNMVGLGKSQDLNAKYPNYMTGVKVYYEVAAQDPVAAKFTSRFSQSNGTTGWLGNPCVTTGCSCYETGTFGPEAGIAKILSKAYPADNIVLIKAAWGGKGLNANWLNPNDPLYNWFLSNTRDMINAALKLDGSATLKGIVWLKGETDGLTSADARIVIHTQKTFNDKTYIGCTGKSSSPRAEVFRHGLQVQPS